MALDKKAILRLAKGFMGRAKNCYRIARPRVERALAFQYASRREKKREMRKLWIQRIGAGAREHGLSYGTFIHGLKQENVWLDRKMLSILASNEPFSFRALTEIVMARKTHRKRIVKPETAASL